MLKIKRIIGVWFSPTLTTAKIVKAIVDSLALSLKINDIKYLDITRIKISEPDYDQFGSSDIVVFGSPVYIGRMPNLISPYFAKFKGNNALAVAAAVYGNRDYDDGLIELYDILNNDGFNTISAGAFIGEHSFSNLLGGGRPDNKDIQIAQQFGVKIAEKILNTDNLYDRITIKGNPYPYKGFYNATTSNPNQKVDIRKVVPKTNADLCTNCGLCAQICPMGSIDEHNCSLITGICIKCCACVKRCPNNAKFFDDQVFLSHKKLLEENFSKVRKEPELLY